MQPSGSSPLEVDRVSPYLVGLFVLPRSFVALTLLLLGYQTAVAMIFAGATRYRVPWDFLVALLAAAGIGALVQLVRARRAPPSTSVTT